MQTEANHKKLQEINFWRRLKSFISDIQVSDMPTEEEKEMILNICEQNIPKEKHADLFKAIDKINEGHYGSAKNFIERYINSNP